MRLFLAVDLPGTLRERLAALQSGLRQRCDGWRWVRPEGIHLTLRFLGEVDAERDAAGRAAWRAALRPLPPFRFSLGAIGRFPPTGRPRVLWLGVTEAGRGGLLPDLAERLERAARNCGFAAERRPFSPHLTLARAAREGRPAWPGDIDGGIDLLVEVDRVILFRSELHPSGARYTALEAFPLEGGAERT